MLYEIFTFEKRSRKRSHLRGFTKPSQNAKGGSHSHPLDQSFEPSEQNLCSTLKTKLDRVPPLMRSNRTRMSAELSPSSDVLLNPSSPPVPQSDVLVVLLICSQIKRGAKESCVLVSATKSAPIGMIT